jgi:hypothetical protein
MRALLSTALLALGLASPATGALANVITDWDAAAVALAPPPPMGQRGLAMVHLAMFDAVNSIERRYRPYRTGLNTPRATSQEAAAAMAAASVLAALHPEKAAELKASLATYVAAIPESAAKSEGLELGGAVADALLQARANDGASAPDAYRPKTKPGAYIPTPITVGSAWVTMVPFALREPSQFRPAAPVSLTSAEWTSDYNEIKAYGSKTSTVRSPQQTEIARFWLMVGPQAYHPLARQLILARQMSVIDSARSMALFSVALTDAYIAVYDAKYHYEFWRPITAIRNADVTGNPATERDPSWQPIDNTPMHPEYPCAHCILSSAAATVMEDLLGTSEIPEVAMTSPTAPGVTHRWTNLQSYSEEVAQSRIWAGFHYRFSMRVGQDMGRKVGRFVCEHILQPVQEADQR